VQFAQLRLCVEQHSPGPPPSRPLAGSAGVIEAACAYLRQSFHSERARSLLLLGAKGSGKTSVVKAIGTILECDRDILAEVVYEDVARMDAEGKLGEIKEKMTGWFETASRRTPCVLVLDGLDVLLGPENEVSRCRRIDHAE
jgi:peroxin-1